MRPTNKQIIAGQKFFAEHKNEAADMFGTGELEQDVAHVFTVMQIAGVIDLDDISEDMATIAEFCYAFGKLAQRDGYPSKES